MFCLRLALALLCAAFLSGEAKLIWRSPTDLYYFKNAQLSYNETLETCCTLGGHVPSASNGTDSEFLTQNAGEATWLFASKDRGGYRWSDSLQFIDSNLWAAYEPDCSGSCAVIVKMGQLYAVKTDTPIARACQFDISSDIHLQQVLSHWKGFESESEDQQKLVEYVLRHKNVDSGSTALAQPADVTGLSLSMSKLQEMVKSTNEQLGQMRQENKKTISSFKQALQVSLSTLDTKAANETIAKLLALRE